MTTTLDKPWEQRDCTRMAEIGVSLSIRVWIVGAWRDSTVLDLVLYFWEEARI